MTEQQMLVQQAMDLVSEAQNLVLAALADKSDLLANFQAYGKYGFDQLLGNGNPYDDGLPYLKEQLEEEEPEE